MNEVFNSQLADKPSSTPPAWDLLVRRIHFYGEARNRETQSALVAGYRIKRGFLIIISFVLTTAVSFGQTILSGSVLDSKGNAVTGANIYLADTYDGTSSAADGSFRFKTGKTGKQQLMVTAVGYNDYREEIDLDLFMEPVHIELTEAVKKLENLVITAGVFEASDQKKSVILRPLDIVTTAGATADIPGVLNTLPGTQSVGESGRLFVRGGDGEEIKTFIDGMLADRPYSLTPDNIPSRMKFSPFLFSGTTFSTGGYSAEYGQALSGTLILNTDDEPGQSQTDISLMSVGGALAHTWKWDESSLFAETSFTDLIPYYAIIQQHNRWEKPPRSWQNTLMYRKNTGEREHLKMFYTSDLSRLALYRPSPINVSRMEKARLDDNAHYLNLNYEENVHRSWKIYAGLAGTYTKDRKDLTPEEIDNRSVAIHGRFTACFDIGTWFGLRFGTDEYLLSNRRKVWYGGGSLSNTSRLWDWKPAVFAETDIYFSEKLAGRAGFRGEYAGLAGNAYIMPRLSLAYKTGRISQISLASGKYSQRPGEEFLYANQALRDEIAWHYILNYQITRDNRTFRVETYYKDYRNLVRYAERDPSGNSDWGNDGYGYAAGMDVFWRDGGSLPNIDYWISYSFLDTRRLYRGYPEESIPSFASRHNFSFVYKQFVPGIRSQIGLTYTFASGRKYDDPNTDAFNDGTTPAYHDLSMNISYLVRPSFIIHFSATNLFGQDRIYGYQYSREADPDGYFSGIPVKQEARHFLFLGVFITIARDKSVNQLRNL